MKPSLHTEWGKKPIITLKSHVGGGTRVFYTPPPITDGKITISPKPAAILHIVRSGLNTFIRPHGASGGITHEWGKGGLDVKEVHVYDGGHRSIALGGDAFDHGKLDTALLRVILGAK